MITQFLKCDEPGFGSGWVESEVAEHPKQLLDDRILFAPIISDLYRMVNIITLSHRLK